AASGRRVRGAARDAGGPRRCGAVAGRPPRPRRFRGGRSGRADGIVNRLAADHEARFWAGVEEAGRFFMGRSDVQRALARLAALLDEQGIPYAVVGAMALNEWGYRRVTVDELSGTS